MKSAISTSPNAMNTYIFVVYLYSTFIHANLNWRFPFLEKFLVTPRFHHWHHGIEREAGKQRDNDGTGSHRYSLGECGKQDSGITGSAMCEGWLLS